MITLFTLAGSTPLQLLVNNASYLAGWQIAAVAANLFPNPCGDAPTQAFFTNWNAAGLNSEILQTVLCGRVGCDITNDYANQFVHFFKYISGIFTQQIATVFQNVTHGYEFLCYNLDPRALTNLTGTTNTRDAMCQLAGNQSTPSWNPPGDGQVPTAEFNYVVSNATALLGWEILAGITSPSAIAYTCDHWGPFASLLLRAGLNPDAMQAVLCNQAAETTLITPDQFWEVGVALASPVFAIQIYNVNQNTYWKEYICAGYQNNTLYNLPQGAMQQVMLNFTTVFTQISARCTADGVQP
jgi:hypothetical protein